MYQVKIVIEMKGGKMQALYSNTPLEYVIINYDKSDRGKNPLSQKHEANMVHPLLFELYDTDTPFGLRIRDRLKGLNF